MHATEVVITLQFLASTSISLLYLADLHTLRQRGCHGPTFYLSTYGTE